MITEEMLIKVINQVHEINKRSRRDQLVAIERSCERIKTMLADEGIIVHDPIGEKYDSSRTDCEANIISNDILKGLTITDVIKPVIYSGKSGKREIVQRGLVIVE
jgi:hypothetical protein